MKLNRARRTSDLTPPGYWREAGLPWPRSARRARRRPWLASLLVFLSVGAALAGGAILAGSVTYFWIASQLPSAAELHARSFQFATTQIVDREGNLLWEIIDPSGGRRTDVSLGQISPDAINATIATEDRYFFLNVGVDPIAITRAVFDNFSEGQIVSGASTITQQLARNVFLTPQERTEKSFSRKLKEAVLAIEINRRYTKQQILEVYFNQIYYGNLAYGLEAAAQTYFGKSARDLTLPEAALLAGLPQSPALTDPYVNPERAKFRQADVLNLMIKAGYLTYPEAKAAYETELALRDLNFNMKAPHFVSLVRQELERIIPPAYLYQAGLRVQTTLDPRLQAIAEAEVQAQVSALAGRHVTNGALVALDVSTGQILALVGSSNYRDKTIDGQVNIVVSPRQPGSTMKPLTYLAAFESLNWTPSTLLMDTPVEYPDFAGQTYRPQNVDLQFRGPVSVRAALANSYNIPAVKTLEQVGLARLKEVAARLGITTLTGDQYGLSLTLGSGEVSLLEMTGAYQALANGGVLVPPTAILKITDAFGREIEPIRPQPRAVLRREHAYLITDILADNETRIPGFGPNSPLKLSRPAAVKTGTSNDFRDNLAIGYTPDIVAGVWVGNADNTPMDNVGGASGAAPIWRNFMEQAHAGLPVHRFSRPPGIVEIEVCADSGTLPSAVCPQRRVEIFAQDQPPLGPEHDMHQLVEIDRPSGLLVNEYCRANIERRYYQVFPLDGREWAMSHGFPQPPTEYCPSAHLLARFSAPVDGQAVRGAVRLEGSAVAPKFSHYQLELGLGTTPQNFIVIQGAITQTMRRSLLGTLDTRQLENGPYTLRLVVFDQLGGFTDDRALILVDNPPDSIAVQTPVTTPPFTPTPTLTATLTLTTSVTPAGTPPAPTPALLLDSAARVFTAPVSIPPQPLPTTP
ncbi:MAG: penicillin-binding protein 1A [Chloroflexota bacterium]|nr:MAG: penicillin-binding protein 1A [Chloroflexota bacterium]